MNPTKRYYFDTSFLAPLILEEASSLQVVTYLRELSTGQFLLSSLTRLEFSSLLAREVRMGGLQESEALAAENICDDLLREAFQIVCPAQDDYVLAGHYIRHYESGLRTADALHLAIAKNQGSDLLLSLDKGLLKAAKMMGIRCGCGIDAPAGRF
ncbi:type II toxin-antitoxin system VapC family toxin [Acidithiobacillus sulfurivorans]|jgi:predicted nucleic acid-binding protein|uniref:Ribonuclease VapC n=1 Tax=Acidithiobacillus sulfurivorans TaxID=1958756 RepID=A0ABS5ZW18_9PROT|nr:type II toxin-antitoxin system VapC family toxin [Acidithiobacillus sulfurivorans]MBU2758868.1 type II toxin-antitoxin system VapC family toxin [Acidithiobacillus sulfurivorans]